VDFTAIAYPIIDPPPPHLLHPLRRSSTRVHPPAAALPYPPPQQLPLLVLAPRRLPGAGFFHIRRRLMGEKGKSRILYSNPQAGKEQLLCSWIPGNELINERLNGLF
ncbi:unnamed protein product, partial [Linum tenue]